MSCEKCDLNNRCPVLNRSQCPINILWDRADESKQAVAEAERIIKGKG